MRKDDDCLSFEASAERPTPEKRRSNKVERHLESVIKIDHRSPRKRADVIREIGLAETHQVVTHDPTGLLQSLFWSNRHLS